MPFQNTAAGAAAAVGKGGKRDQRYSSPSLPSCPAAADAVLWALGHVCSTDAGLRLVLSLAPRAIAFLCTTAETHPRLSVRGTGVCVLGLVAGSELGRWELAKWGWEGGGERGRGDIGGRLALPKDLGRMVQVREGEGGGQGEGEEEDLASSLTMSLSVPPAVPSHPSPFPTPSRYSPSPSPDSVVRGGEGVREEEGGGGGGEDERGVTGSSPTVPSLRPLPSLQQQQQQQQPSQRRVAPLPVISERSSTKEKQEGGKEGEREKGSCNSVEDEILLLIVQLSNYVTRKDAQLRLIRLRRKSRYRKKLESLRFYLRVQELMGVYAFKVPVRRFLTELFGEVDLLSTAGWGRLRERRGWEEGEEEGRE